jgi:Phage tail protein (Tail_P2_I)
VGGFGRASFGSGPFGQSDVGGDLVVDLFPTDYFDDTLTLPVGQTVTDNDVDPLLMLLKTYANSVNNRRDDIENFTTILDPDVTPVNVLLTYAGDLGIDIDKNDPEFLQRTLVNRASQWLQLKSTVKGYEVRGLASGFQVQIQNFWRVDPSLASFIPPFYQSYFVPQNADPTAQPILHTNQPPGTFAGTPSVEGPLYAKSSYVQAIFTLSNYDLGTNYNILLNLVIYKIKDVVAIHHEFIYSTFQIEMSCSVTPTCSITEIQERIKIFEFNEGNYYDIITGDTLASLDIGLYDVQITIS